MLSKLFMKIEDYRLACEALWGCASLAIQERRLNVELPSSVERRRFAFALSRDIGRRFTVFEMCNFSFYTNDYNAHDLSVVFMDAKELIQLLREFQLSDEKRKELESDNFME
uniref:Uncharacterized protein n=1 Tax=Caenorhabditis tropicalis TaxID=1561998 RepID=A0A1I7TCQ7_9PELO